MNPTANTKAQQGFDSFTRMVHDTIGICIPQTKRNMIEARLGSRVQALGLRDIQDYFRHLFVEGGLRSEMVHIEETVTTNKTDFFREKDHFQYLRDTILGGRTQQNGTAMFRAWSAASSTGAEPYSMAMLFAEHALVSPDFNWRVLGTDISGRVLEHARRGIYSGTVIDPVPDALRARYLFEGQKEWQGKWRIAPLLRNRVHFKKLNLMNDEYEVDANLDVIFLRNVLIYFDPEDQLAVLRKVARHVAPGGHLFVGNSESMIVRMSHFRQVAPAIYRKEP
ncbi:chemotaxis protein methyltransferase [Marivita lacus]|uniref:Chemotaxis protein methyltransferase n=1 Tax=Marivita lacus TaxID=1323742 RepID=A0ABQ1KZH8_9RHOB|nr:CheR family methyltransferase [Marivita lacus]GGC14400.1 chemotaxis protein methyltransferase [Marivita lacus]